MKQGLSERRSCELVQISRSSFRYVSNRKDDSVLVGRLHGIAKQYVRYGYRRAHALLVRGGQCVNHKRVLRLWRQEGLCLPRKRKRRRRKRSVSVPLQPTYPDHVWTYDFMEDTTAEGRKLRILTLVDEFTRDALAIAVGRSMPAEKVIRVLDGVFEERGVTPTWLRSDNGPEFIAEDIIAWLRSKGVDTHHIDPGSPWQNPWGERFNGSLRDECLNLEVFYSVSEARVVIEQWRREYNEARPHSRLGYLTPKEYRAQCDSDSWGLCPQTNGVKLPYGRWGPIAGSV
jgi:transposase InsO family protein